MLLKLKLILYFCDSKGPYTTFRVSLKSKKDKVKLVIFEQDLIISVYL